LIGYHETVKPSHLQFIEPTKRYADIIIPRGGDNQVGVGVLVSSLKASAGRIIIICYPISDLKTFFLDIETVPAAPSFEELNEPLRTHWEKKSCISETKPDCRRRLRAGRYLC
jgi:hypothetical protein